MCCWNTSPENCEHEGIVVDSKIEIIEVTCETPYHNSDPFGTIVGGHIIVRGLLIEVALIPPARNVGGEPDEYPMVKKGGVTAPAPLGDAKSNRLERI
jgi:hypothetical protein